MKYQLKDLKEGVMVEFNNSEYYGIITKDCPDKNHKLCCVYQNGEWDTLETILRRNIVLYKSDNPIPSFLNLIAKGTEFCIRYRGLKIIQSKVDFITAFNAWKNTGAKIVSVVTEDYIDGGFTETAEFTAEEILGEWIIEDK